MVVGMRKTDEDGEARRINSSSMPCSCGSTGKGPLGTEEILNTGVFSMGRSEQVRSLGAALELDWRMWEERKMYMEDLQNDESGGETVSQGKVERTKYIQLGKAGREHVEELGFKQGEEMILVTSVGKSRV